MKSKHLLIPLFAVLATILLVGNLLPVPMVSDETYSAHALGRRPPTPPTPRPPSPGPPTAVPEPSTMFLLAGGLTSLGAYLYHKQKRREK